MNTVKLSNCEVSIKASLTWGDVERIKDAMTSGIKVGNTGISGFDTSAILESKYRLLEIAIVEIRQDGKTQKFTREWMNSLSVEDGELLYAEVDKLNGKKNSPASPGDQN
jgi:hypothetical protein